MPRINGILKHILTGQSVSAVAFRRYNYWHTCQIPYLDKIKNSAFSWPQSIFWIPQQPLLLLQSSWFTATKSILHSNSRFMRWGAEKKCLLLLRGDVPSPTISVKQPDIWPVYLLWYVMTLPALTPDSAKIGKMVHSRIYIDPTQNDHWSIYTISYNIMKWYLICSQESTLQRKQYFIMKQPHWRYRLK